MTPGLRKFALTAHITASVGWLGAVAAFIALTAAGLTGPNPQMERAVYLVAEPLTWFVIVPLALASLLTGLISALGTPWGLFRHYWVLAKLVLTAIATLILLGFAQSVGHVPEAPVQAHGRGGLPSYLLHSVGGLVLLLVTTTLSVYKPRGLTPYGQRTQSE